MTIVKKSTDKIEIGFLLLILSSIDFLLLFSFEIDLLKENNSIVT